MQILQILISKINRFFQANNIPGHTDLSLITLIYYLYTQKIIWPLLSINNFINTALKEVSFKKTN